MTLSNVSHPLPVAWDGRAVTWEPWTVCPVVVCGKLGRERCDCGSVRAPFTSRGLREPAPEHIEAASSIAQIHTRSRLVWPVYSLHAFRCPDCGEVAVFDSESDEHWILGPEDYGPTGSTPPPEWTGGLFDLLYDTEGTENA